MNVKATNTTTKRKTKLTSIKTAKRGKSGVDIKDIVSKYEGKILLKVTLTAWDNEVRIKQEDLFGLQSELCLKLINHAAFDNIAEIDSTIRESLKRWETASHFAPDHHLIDVFKMESMDNVLKAWRMERTAAVAILVRDWPKLAAQAKRTLAKVGGRAGSLQVPETIAGHYKMGWAWMTASGPMTVEELSHTAFRSQLEKAEKNWALIRDMYITALDTAIRSLCASLVKSLKEVGDGAQFKATITHGPRTFIAQLLGLIDPNDGDLITALKTLDQTLANPIKVTAGEAKTSYTTQLKALTNVLRENIVKPQRRFKS